MRNILFSLSIIIGFGLITSQSQAAVLTSVDRATFAAAVAGGDINSENFDALAVGSIPNAIPGVTITTSSGDVVVTDQFLTTTGLNGIGSNILNAAGVQVNFFNNTETVTFTFATAITAFAIDINTFAATNGAFSVMLNTGDTISSLNEVFPSNSTGQFIGFVSDSPFTSLILSSVTGFTYTLDTLVFGDAADLGMNAAVPLPAAIWLFAPALGGIFAARRKRKAA